MLPNTPTAFSILSNPKLVSETTGIVYYADLANAYAPTEVWTRGENTHGCTGTTHEPTKPAIKYHHHITILMYWIINTKSV